MAKIVHLIKDHDSIGYPDAWCEQTATPSTDDLSTVTCRDCLAACAAYGVEAAGRLVEVEASK